MARVGPKINCRASATLASRTITWRARWHAGVVSTRKTALRELATIGDPLADFAYHLMIYRLPDLAFPGLQGVDLAAAGLPGEAEYLAASS
jgi:hypothetical protein